MKLRILPDILKIRHICVLILLLSVAPAVRAQEKIISLEEDEMSVSEVIGSIREQAGYLFAFDSRTFDVTRKVRVEPGVYDVHGALSLLIRGTHFSYMIHSSYVVINSSPRSEDAFADSDISADLEENDGPKPSSFWQLPDGPLDYSLHPLPIDNTVGIPVFYAVYRSVNRYLPVHKTLPRVALKTNLLYGAAALAPNLSVEIGIKNNRTLEFSASHNGWERKGEEKSQLNHMILRGEYRWWMCERYSGHFVGANALFTRYHVGGEEVPLVFKKTKRYDGYGYGAGFTYGYNVPLSKRWNLEFNVGVGAVYMSYDRYSCDICDTDGRRESKFYVGPTRFGVTLGFMIK